MAETLDYFVSGVLTQDTRKRMETGEELNTYLQDETTSLYCEDMDKIVDGLALWVNSSSFKVSLLGLELILQLIGRMKNSFRPYVTSVLPAVIDRLGDNKDQVRENARAVLLNLMNPGSTPQYVAERLGPGFTHKLWKVKEEILTCLQCALNEWGSKNFVLSKLVPQIVKLLDDPNGQVRDQAMMTLVEFYRHVGEKIKNDLNRREINPSKLSTIFAKMDDVKNKGLMVANEGDELDASNAQSTLSKKPKSVVSGRSQSVVPRIPQGGSQEKGVAAGALDEEGFARLFHDCPKILICSGRDVSDKMNRIRDTLSDTNKDWEKRQDALKELRSLVVHGATSYPEFQISLRSCVASLRNSVLDLRSQIVREACITIAFFSQDMGKDFEQMAEVLIQALVQLLQNSAKIMSSSGFIALKFIVQNTHSHRLVSHITCNLTSKSTIIRRQCCELMEQMLRVWPVPILERQLTTIQEAIKRGLADADPEARVHSRRAYWNFEEHFKTQAASIFSSLDPSQQKHLTAAQVGLNGCSGSSSSSSTSSINVYSNSAVVTRTLPNKTKMRSPSGDRVRHQTGVSRLPQSTMRQSQLPQKTHSGSEDMQRSSSTANLTSSTSRIARPTSGNSNNDNNNNNSNFHSLRLSHSSSDLSTPAKKPPVSKPLRRNASMRLPRSSTVKVSNAEARHRKSPNPSSGGDGTLPRPSKFGSSSQPSSRSVSPSSRYSYISQQHTNTLSYPNELPLATGTSQRYGKVGSMRDPSPSRSEVSETKRRKSAAPMRVPLSSSTAASWSVASELDGSIKNLVRRSVNIAKPRRLESNGYSSEAGVGEEVGSETSSLCSDNSGKSFNGEDVSMTINSLLSGSWIERRDSLVCLQSLLQNHRQLSSQEVRRVTDLFDRLFFDQNPKVFSVFLDTLVHFISSHKNELGNWVGSCLPMLLNKLGSETTPLIQAKIQKVLDNIRVFFPAKTQFQVLTKFMVDQMKNASVGVKLSVLGYLHELTLMMEADDLIISSDVKLAITRIITCSTEPKSPEVRKASIIVFIRLYRLNQEVFRSMLDALPKSFQDSGNRILQENSCSLDHDDDRASSSSVIPSPSPSPNMFDGRQRSPSSRLPVRLNTSDSENINPMFSDDVNNATTQKRVHGLSNPMVQLGNRPLLDAFNSRFSNSPKRDIMLEDDEMMINGAHECPISKSLLSVDKDIFSEAFSFHNADLTAMERVDDEDDDEYLECPKPDEIDMIIQELAYKNERVEERKYKLVHLIIIARNKDSTPVWDHHSKTILMLLLDILKNDLEAIREMSLKVIVELVYNHMSRFVGHEELILSSVIEARKDPSQAVAATAQDSALVIASLFPVQVSVPIILPFIMGNDSLTRLLAFRIQLSIVETVTDVQQMRDLLPVIIPGILKGYEDSMSAIRKDSVFTLVRIYLLVGDELKPYLKDMSNSKLKLLNLYIKRALVHKENVAGATSR